MTTNSEINDIEESRHKDSRQNFGSDSRHYERDREYHGESRYGRDYEKDYDRYRHEETRSSRRYLENQHENKKRRDTLELTPEQWQLVWGESPTEISQSSDSEDEKRKRKKKEKRKKKYKKKKQDDSVNDHKKRKRESHSDDERHKRKRNKKRLESSSDDSSSSNSEQEYVHKKKQSSQLPESSVSPPPMMPNVSDYRQEEPDFGPKPLPTIQPEVRYGGDMLPGEASAIAKYVQENKRIPRRGEVGLTSEEIERFEKLGYVMSGSRHQMMNAVRLRKENQVISVEEKRKMAMLAYEERTKRENKLIQQFRDMVKNEK
jgi:hypothetical protein